ncbi:MAG: ABC transporter permease [Vicinamibacterales bacterium]|nr:ABC transporter permease [Vicinamibacterales bacterium]
MARFSRFWSPAIRALVIKELNQVRHDRRMVVALILPPLLQLMIFGTVMSPEVTGIKLGVVDDSRSTPSRNLVASLSESGSFRLEASYGSVEALSEEIRQGNIDAGVVIPREFAGDLDRGRTTMIQVLLNAMNANTAAVSQGYIRGVLQGFNGSLGKGGVRSAERGVDGAAPRRGLAMLHPLFLFNPGLVSSWFLVTGLIGQLLLMNGMITASATMVKEREAGTLEQLLMTPLRTSEIIVAKILPQFALLMIPAAIALVVVRFWFDVPFRGSPLLFAVAVAACLMCGIGFGTVVATLTRSAQQAQLASFFIMPPMMSLSGTMTPAEAMPAWMQPWTVINPIYHFGFIARGTLIRGSELSDVWTHLVALVVIASVVMAVSVWRFRQQLA